MAVSQQQEGRQALDVFVSYARNDEKLWQQLETNLKLLGREGVIETWHNGMISPGQVTMDQTDAHLNAAKIILLLVSPDFLASDYCWDAAT